MRAKKTYYLKRINDERRASGAPKFPRRLDALRFEAEHDEIPFDDSHAKFLADFMVSVIDHRGRYVKYGDSVIAARLLAKLMAQYNKLATAYNALVKEKSK
jgi:hypothetical protein